MECKCWPLAVFPSHTLFLSSSSVLSRFRFCSYSSLVVLRTTTTRLGAKLPSALPLLTNTEPHTGQWGQNLFKTSRLAIQLGHL